LRPKVLLEIGTAKGGTLFLLSKAAAPSAKIISCDLPGGLYGGGYPQWKSAIFHRIIPPPQSLHLIRGDSHQAATRDQVLAALGGEKVDFMLIDGDHSYAGVKQDFLTYRNFVRPGGVIALHDILPNRFDRDIDVSRFWKEIRESYAGEEIVDDRNQG